MSSSKDSKNPRKNQVGRKKVSSPKERDPLAAFQSDVKSVMGTLGAMPVKQRSVLISRLCHAFNTFPKGVSEASSTPKSPPSPPSASKQRESHKQPKAANANLKGTHVDALCSLSSKLLKRISTAETKSSEAFGLVHTALTRMRWETKAIVGSSRLEEVSEARQTAFVNKALGFIDNERDPAAESVIRALVHYVDKGLSNKKDKRFVRGHQLLQSGVEAISHYLQYVYSDCRPDGIPDECWPSAADFEATQNECTEVRTPESAQGFRAKLEARKAAKASKSRSQHDADEAIGGQPPAKRAAVQQEAEGAGKEEDVDELGIVEMDHE